MEVWLILLLPGADGSAEQVVSLDDVGACVDERHGHQEVEYQVDDHHPEHLPVDTDSPLLVLLNLSFLDIKIFPGDRDVHVLKAVSQDVQSRALHPHFLDQEELDDEDAEELDGEQDQEAGEVTLESEAGVGVVLSEEAI